MTAECRVSNYLRKVGASDCLLPPHRYTLEVFAAKSMMISSLTHDLSRFITVAHMSNGMEASATGSNQFSGPDGIMYDEILLQQKGYLKYEHDIAGKGRLNASLSGAIRCLF